MGPPDPFDRCSAGYTEVLNAGLAWTGGNRAVFGRLRIEELRRAVRRYADSPIARILDFGCGDGFTTVSLAEAFGAEVVGMDSSRQSLNVAQQRAGCGDISFIHEGGIRNVQPFDLVYCNGVFHHIPPEHRESAMTLINESLVVGGLFGLFDNTPWNPGTRLVMRRLPFDRDAVVVRPGHIRALMARCGFDVLTTRYLFSLPPFLGPVFFWDKYLRWLPIGGQYLVLARKSSSPRGTRDVR
jgi:SAM-dependent methyltransferase